MRVLIVSPALRAAHLLASQLIDHLSARHTFGLVTAAGPADTDACASLARRGAVLATVPADGGRRRWGRVAADPARALAEALPRARAAFRPDVLHLESSVLAPLARVAGVPCLLHCHEGPAARGFDAATACVVHSAEDRRLAAVHVPSGRIAVIPIAIDADRYAYRRTGNASRLVFTGDLARPGDLDAARRLATSILPRIRRRVPRAELMIAATGSVEPARVLARIEGVRIGGRLADLRASVWGAGAYVSPLGGGAERAARILEALALGTPVVAWPASLSHLDDVVPGQHVLAADSDTDVADAVSLLIREPVVAGALARNARALIERGRTWPAIAAQYDDLYQRLGRMVMEPAA